MGNVFLDIGFYWFLTRICHLQYLLAALCSFIIVVSWSFYINRKWTFRHTGTDLRRQYIKFFTANSISAALNLTLLFLTVDYLNIYDLLAKIIVSVTVGLFNFSLNKAWTFKSVATVNNT